MPTEADTCRKLVVPKLQAAGWDNEPHSIAEQRWFTPGRIVVHGNQATRRRGKRADYLLRVVKLTDYSAEKVRTLCAGPDELRARWADADQRADITHQLAERGIDFQQVALQTGQPEADPFDLLCHLAFNAPLLTRRQRADRVKRQQTTFFNYFAPEAREILSDLLEKYAAEGELQFTLPDVLKVPPISSRGNVNEIAARFGSDANLRNAVNRLQSLLYAA